MDSCPSPSISLSSITTKDEFEGIEVAEFDANALWELLHDEHVGEEDAGRGGAAPKQAPGVVDTRPDSVVESYWDLNNDNDNNSNTAQDFDWFRIMEETSIPCNEMGGWYGEPCMEEILEMGDYSFSNTAIFADEIGYIGLWHDS